MTDQALSYVDEFLAGVAAKPVSRGSLIFALDATGSRERTWDTAAELQTQMFREIASLGSLDVQLIYFRGTQGLRRRVQVGLGQQSHAAGKADGQDPL